MKKSNNKKKRGGNPSELNIINQTPQYMKDLDKYYNKNNLKRLHQEEIKKINLNTYIDKIPEKIKNAIITAFKNYKLTNNGVIFCDSSKSCKRGGATLNQMSEQNLIDQLQTYCPSVIHRNSDDNIDISNFIVHLDNGNSILKEFPLLKGFIHTNRNHHSNIEDFSYNPKYEYQNVTTAINNITDNKVHKEYYYHDYNKDIVEAYEKNFFEARNITTIKAFIVKQMDYLKTLNNIERKIIQDYTKPESFDYYKLSKSTNQDDIVKFRDYNKNFGDSFYHQIHTLQNNGTIPRQVLDQAKIDSINSPTRLPATGLSPITLNEDEWRLVLDKFMTDLNEIILKAPPVEDVIHCYRGVSVQYITGGQPYHENNLLQFFNRDNLKIKSFVSNRLGSFSVDFNTSKQFYDDLANNPLFNDKRCLYRTAIMPGCRILYVAPLSLLSYEVEFISPVDSKFLYNIDLSPTLSNNNIDREFGICSREDEQFRSFDIVLAFTPQPSNALTVISTVLGDIGESAINGYLNVCGCCPFSEV